LTLNSTNPTNATSLAVRREQMKRSKLILKYHRRSWAERDTSRVGYDRQAYDGHISEEEI